MEVVGLLILVVIVVAVYKSAFAAGNRRGSRKGYGVGFDRGRRGRGASGCLVMAVAGIVSLVLAASLWACR